MKLTEVYDSSSHLLRDTLGYWLPGMYFTLILFFRFSQIGLLSIQKYIEILSGLNIYSFLLLVLISIINGYVFCAIAHPIFYPIYRLYLKKKKKLSLLQSINIQIGLQEKNKIIANASIEKMFNDYPKETRDIFYELNILSSKSDVMKNYLTEVARYNLLRLFYESMALMFLVSVFIFYSWGFYWIISFLLLTSISVFLAIKNREENARLNELSMLLNYLESCNK